MLQLVITMEPNRFPTSKIVCLVKTKKVPIKRIVDLFWNGSCFCYRNLINGFCAVSERELIYEPFFSSSVAMEGDNGEESSHVLFLWWQQVKLMRLKKTRVVDTKQWKPSLGKEKIFCLARFRFFFILGIFPTLFIQDCCTCCHCTLIINNERVKVREWQGHVKWQDKLPFSMFLFMNKNECRFI